MIKVLHLLVILSTVILFAPDASAVQKKAKPVLVAPKAADPPKVMANYGKYDFSFTTMNGKTLKLSDYAGKVVLVNIWAPWCGPCKIEIPGFMKLYDQYREKGFEILGVAVQTNERDVKTFVEKSGMKWPIGINDGVAEKYGTYGLPDNYLFAQDGSVAKHFIGYTREEALKNALDEAFKKNVPSSSK